MKIGIDSYCYHRFFGEIYDNQKNPDAKMGYEDFIKRAIGLDVDGVSLETCFLKSIDKPYLKELKALIDEGGLEVVVAWGHPDGFEGGKKPGAIDDLKRHFLTCQILGADVMRIVGSSYSFRYEPKEPQIKRLSEIMKEAVKMAEDNGVRLAMENHFDFTANEIKKIVENVDSEYFGITFDTGNALRIGDNPVEAAEGLSPYIYATHIKDVAPLYCGNPSDWYFLPVFL